MRLRAVAALIAASLASAITFPSLDGNHKVGISVVQLTHYRRIDPYAPDHGPRNLVASVFYPIKGTGACEKARYMPDPADNILGSTFGLTNGTLGGIDLNACANNRTCDIHRPPVLIFSPGFSASRLVYSATVENLASFGYFVVLVDHTYEPPVVEFPDGELAFQQPAANMSTDAASRLLLNTRIADVSFIIDQLPQWQRNSSILGFRPSFDLNKLGVLGHSFGGATALATIFNDTRPLCGIDNDGGLSGPVVDGGLKRPFLLFGNAVAELESAQGWEGIWEHSSGYKRLLTVNGTQHLSFTDLPALLDLLGSQIPPPLAAQAGSISGPRIAEIESRYFDAFFSWCFGSGSGKLLDGPSNAFPEVIFHNQSSQGTDVGPT